MVKRVKKLSSEDQRIWRQVTKTVIPYKEHLQIENIEFETDKTKTLKNPKPEKAVLRSTTQSYQPAVQRPKSKDKKYDLNPIEHSIHKKIARGHILINAQIDLHGMTQNIAHQVLLSFLQTAFSRNDRYVLVITGKGNSIGTRGILKQVVPEWFSKPEFKAFVSGFEKSSRFHGGEGAFYVRLRRKDGYKR